MNNTPLTLCKPCAVKLSRTGRRLKSIPSISEKITCAECGRRRYGQAYEEAPAVNKKEDGRK